MVQPLRIGVSACFFHEDPRRPVFKGKTLLYVERSMMRWLMSEGDVAFLVPQPTDAVPCERIVAQLDGLVLHGGSDVCPRTYGEEPLRPEWEGDQVRDLYELELVRAFLDAGKPVLGVCRGVQVLNVYFGGTLYQDIGLQVTGACVHRDWEVYDQNIHEVHVEPGTTLAGWVGEGPRRVNSVHHQAIRDLGKDLVVEARSCDDRLVEAIRFTGEGWAYGVQWHPEFHEPGDATLLDGQPLLRAFLDEARRAR